VTRVSPVAPHETNRRPDDTTIETNLEVAQDVVRRDDVRHQMRERTTMHLRQIEKHLESQSVANPHEIFLHVNHHEARKA